MLIKDGNKAVGEVAYKFSDICAIYPITPSSPMASTVDKLSSKKETNVFKNVVKVVQMQSEAGVAGCMHGSLLAGSLSTTFTSSQGLLLMIPNMYKMAARCYLLLFMWQLEVLLLMLCLFLVIIKIFMLLDKLVFVCYQVLP